MDDLKLDAIGLHLHLMPTCHQSGPRWQGSRCVGLLHVRSWTADQSLIWRQRWFRVKISLTREMIWTALVQHKTRSSSNLNLVQACSTLVQRTLELFY